MCHSPACTTQHTCCLHNPPHMLPAQPTTHAAWATHHTCCLHNPAHVLPAQPSTHAACTTQHTCYLHNPAHMLPAQPTTHAACTTHHTCCLHNPPHMLPAQLHTMVHRCTVRRSHTSTAHAVLHKIRTHYSSGVPSPQLIQVLHTCLRGVPWMREDLEQVEDPSFRACSQQ